MVISLLISDSAKHPMNTRRTRVSVIAGAALIPTWSHFGLTCRISRPIYPGPSCHERFRMRSCLHEDFGSAIYGLILSVSLKRMRNGGERRERCAQFIKDPT